MTALAPMADVVQKQLEHFRNIFSRTADVQEHTTSGGDSNQQASLSNAPTKDADPVKLNTQPETRWCGKRCICVTVSFLLLAGVTSIAVCLGLPQDLEELLDVVVAPPSASIVENGPRPVIEPDADGVSQMQYIIGLADDANETQKTDLCSYLTKQGSVYESLPLVDALEANLTSELVVELQSGSWSIVLSLERNTQITDVAVPVDMPSTPSSGQLRSRRLSDREESSDVGTVIIPYTNVSSNSQGAPWHLDFLDGRPTDAMFDTNLTGEGVDIYIVDTGIRKTHQEFMGRASGSGKDVQGHGTAMAGAAVGVMYGAAKRARAISVQVLDASGRGSAISVIRGLSTIAASGSRTKNTVVSMSLGGKRSLVMDNAVQNLINEGFPVVVAAGNSAADACNFSPAAVPDALTIGSVGRNSRVSRFSNKGDCVDLYAPGENIVSPAHTGDTTFVSVSGTSSACAIAAGVASLFLQADTPRESLFARMMQAARNIGSLKLLQVPGVAPNPGAPVPLPQPTSKPPSTDWLRTEGSVNANNDETRSLVAPTFRVSSGDQVIATMDCQCYLTSRRCNVDLYLYVRQWFVWVPVALSRSRTNKERIQVSFRSNSRVRALAYARRGSAQCEIKSRVS